MVKEEKQRDRETIRKLRQYSGHVSDLEHLQKELIRILGEKEEFILANNNTLDGMPRGTKTGDPTYRKAEEAIRLFDNRINKTKESVSVIEGKKKAIDYAVAKLLPEEKYIIKSQYFVLGKPTPMWAVAKKLVYCERQCYRIRDTAISKIARLL